MGFMCAVKSCFSKYVGFGGRAPRSEFWYFYLFTMIVSVVLGIVVGALMLPPYLSLVFSALVLLPSLAVSFRRLHDVDRSAWWLLLYLVPILGFLVLLFWYVQRGTDGENRFGPNPLDQGVGAQDEAFTEETA